MLRIIQRRKIFLTISGVMVAASILAIAVWGFNYGLDFTGGSILEVSFSSARPELGAVQSAAADLNIEGLMIQPVGEDRMIFRFKAIGDEKYQELKKRIGAAAISAGGTGGGEAGEAFEIQRYDSIQPSVGQDLKIRAVYAIFFVLAAIVIYIGWTFRNVSKPVASWKYGIAALIALFHDITIVLGVYAVLGHFFGIEINTPFVAAALTVLGYSVNDTIVVFDRIRENLPQSEENFEGTVNISVNQTLVRSINTSLTVMLVLLSIIFIGGGTIKDFALVLAIGIFVGTYSSIFIASPALVVWEKLSSR